MKAIERLMVRRLGGELSPEEAAELEKRLAEEPEAAELLSRMSDQWQSLGDLPPAGPAIDLAPDLMAAVRREADSGLGWSAAPAWARAFGLLALVCGSLLGSILAGSEGLGGGLSGEGFRTSEVWDEPLSLSESYWIGIESLDAKKDESRRHRP